MKHKINSIELMHYGIMGMKWGVRNAETKARYKRDGNIYIEIVEGFQEKHCAKYRLVSDQRLIKHTTII